MIAPKPHILSACVKRDAYQNWILSSLHAKHSHSVAADTGPVAGQDRSQNFPQRSEAFRLKSHSLQCWVFSISCSHTLHCPRAFTAPHPYGFKRSCDIASSSVCKTPCFSTSTLFYCVFSKFLNTYYARYLALRSSSIAHSIVLHLRMLLLT